MKKYLAILSILGLLSSFVLYKQKHETVKRNFEINNFQNTTLDSLQGTWISSKDSSWRLTISRDTIFDFYDSEPTDTSKFIISDSCLNFDYTIPEFALQNHNGKYLSTYSVNGIKYDGLCYKISFLSLDGLELVYDHKYLGFKKKK